MYSLASQASTPVSLPPRIHQRSLCVCAGAHLQCVNSRQVCFSHYFPASAEPQGQPEERTTASSGPAWAGALVFQSTRNISELFQSPLWSSHSQDNLFKFLAHFLFAALVITAADRCHIKQLLLVAFNRHSRAGLSPWAI